MTAVVWPQRADSTCSACRERYVVVTVYLDGSLLCAGCQEMPSRVADYRTAEEMARCPNVTTRRVTEFTLRIAREEWKRMAATEQPCGCAATCGDDGDIDGPGTCKGLPMRREPLVEVVLVPRTGVL